MFILGEDLKQKGNLPHAGNDFTSPVPTRNLTKGCYSAVNFEVTHRNIPVGHHLESLAHITSTILTLSSRLAALSFCWKKIDACWCNKCDEYFLMRIIKKKAYFVWGLRLSINERRTQEQEFFFSDIGVKIRHGFLQARHHSDGKVVCSLILISFEFLNIVNTAPPDLAGGKNKWVLVKLLGQLPVHCWYLMEDDHGRQGRSKLTATAQKSVKILVIRHYIDGVGSSASAKGLKNGKVDGEGGS